MVATSYSGPTSNSSGGDGDVTGSGICFIRFKKRLMENRMYPKMRRKIKAECDIINLTGNTERTESSIIQLIARLSSLDVTT